MFFDILLMLFRILLREAFGCSSSHRERLLICCSKLRFSAAFALCIRWHRLVSSESDEDGSLGKGKFFDLTFTAFHAVDREKGSSSGATYL
jgi:hypothetical protein